MAAALAALGRAVEEIEALEAIFGYDEGGFTVHSEAALASARSAVESGGGSPGGSADWAPPQLDIELQLEVEEGGGGGGDDEAAEAPTARLRIGMPPGYPESRSASVSVSVAGLTRGGADAITAALTTKATALLGDEAVMELVQALQEVAPGVLAAERAAIAAAAAPAREPAGAVDDGSCGRRWMWAHHISSAARRGLICKEAQSLSLGGYLKPGYPGIVVVEGSNRGCEEFVDWMKTSSKHTQAVRGQISALPAGERQLPEVFEELGVNDM